MMKLPDDADARLTLTLDEREDRLRGQGLEVLSSKVTNGASVAAGASPDLVHRCAVISKPDGQVIALGEGPDKDEVRATVLAAAERELDRS